MQCQHQTKGEKDNMVSVLGNDPRTYAPEYSLLATASPMIGTSAQLPGLLTSQMFTAKFCLQVTIPREVQ